MIELILVGLIALAIKLVLIYLLIVVVGGLIYLAWTNWFFTVPLVMVLILLTFFYYKPTK